MPFSAQSNVVSALGIQQCPAFDRGPVNADDNRIREISRRSEPAHSEAYILSSPTLKYLCKLDDFSVPRLVSKGLLQKLGVDLEEMLAATSPFWGGDDQRVNDTVQGDPRWLKGEIAFFEAVHRAADTHGSGLWWHSIGAPIAETGSMLWEGILDPAPNKFWVKLTPFSDIDLEPSARSAHDERR